MKLKIWKWIHLGRNVRIISILLMGITLSGLFGCSKTEEYTVAVEEAGESDLIQEEQSISSEGTAEPAELSVIYVDVCGAVKYPGVYELPKEARVFEAVELAGGMLEEAYANALNRAEKLIDGQKLYVPTWEEWENGSFSGDIQEASSQEDGLVNINTADAAKLCELPGIGETRAQAIVQYREEHGNFGSIEEIQNVSGIKSGVYSKIKDFIKVQ